MALTAQESNYVTRISTLASQLLKLRDELATESETYYSEGFDTSITTADLAVAFPHLTQAKVGGCITAFDGVLANLGSGVNGQTVNLRKMQG